MLNERRVGVEWRVGWRADTRNMPPASTSSTLTRRGGAAGPVTAGGLKERGGAEGEWKGSEYAWSAACIPPCMMTSAQVQSGAVLGGEGDGRVAPGF